MDRKTFAKLWEDAWDQDGWHTPWSRAVGGLTATQAAWVPGPGRHSIWQQVTHVAFWREFNLNLLAGKPKPDREEVKRLEFAAPAQPSEAEWEAAKERLHRTHREIGAAMADPSVSMERIMYHLPHDAYHLGQVMHLRAALGFAPMI